jgi:hypothetical protein
MKDQLYALMTKGEGSLALICELTGMTEGRLNVGAGNAPAIAATVTVTVLLGTV